MTLKMGINGFGRIGRLVFRAAVEHPDVEVVGVNHKSRRLKSDADFARKLAYALKYDSVHGIMNAEVDGEGDKITVDGKEYKVYTESEPSSIPWDEMGADVVVESTGKLRKVKDASSHLDSGAKKVIITAPAREDDCLTVVIGVNEEHYDPSRHHVVSNASCTTNCLAPVAKVLHEHFGIEKGLMNTVHAMTNDQQILDMPHRDERRGRAAGMSIIPTTTGAAKAVGKVLPELNGKLNGMAMRVPTPNVSVVDFVAELGKNVTAEEVNNVLKDASQNELKGILAYSDMPLVSTDYNGDPRSSIVDGPSTMVLSDNMVRVIAWYDNEWGYSKRVVDLAAYMAKKGF